MPLIGKEKMTNEEYNKFLYIRDDIFEIEEDLQRTKSMFGNNNRRLLAAKSAQYKLDRLIKFMEGNEDD